MNQAERIEESAPRSERIWGLDSLRFLAFLMIFFFHSTSYFSWGYLGVDFFFVLSSFLLSLLALKEIKNTGHFSRKNFFIRRVLRIFPLYYLIVFILMIAWPFLASLSGRQIGLPESPWMYWVLLSNYEYSDTLFALKFLWSIAVEEQFYLLFILFAFLFKKHVWVFIVLLLLAYALFMLKAQELELPIYTNTLSHLVNFAAGIGTAYFYAQGMRANAITWIAFFASFIFLQLPLEALFFNLVFSIWISLLILNFIGLSEFLKERKLFMLTEHLGIYTYGLYVYSGMVLTAGSVLFHAEQNFLNSFLQLAVLIPIAMASYHFYEKRFLQLKRRFRGKTF